MSGLASWEIEENARWKSGNDAATAQDGVPAKLLSETPARQARPEAHQPQSPVSFTAPRPHEENENIDAALNPQNITELKRIGAYDSYVKYHRQVTGVCGQIRGQLKNLNSALFKSCALESLPERYADVCFELEENWRKRKQSQEAVKRGIFLATELIKVFPIYRFFTPLASPLRLVGCVADKLDASQLSLVIGEINRQPSAPYSEPSFLGMRCTACDRLFSLYLRTKEYEKALDVCDCAVALESIGPRPKNRFRRSKKALARMIQKRDEMKNAWSFNYDAQFKRSLGKLAKGSVAHHGSSNSALH